MLVNAAINVDAINEELDLELPEGTWDSLGGLVFGMLGRVPAPGDSVDLDGATLIVERLDGHRVTRVRLVRRDHELAESDGA